MAHLLFIKDITARNSQDIGDFVLAYDFEPTATEKAIFQHVPAPNVSAADVVESLEKLKTPDKNYPKFPFNKKDLTAKDITDIESQSVNKTQTLELIVKMTLKKPVEATAALEE